MNNRILIIDDHEVARHGLQRIIEEYTDATVVASIPDGSTALKSVEELQVDMVTMDIMMPDKSGFDISTELFKKFPEIKIIIISGFVSKDLLHHALRIGAHGYLIKSIVSEEIADAIKTAQDGKFFFSRMIPEETKLDARDIQNKSALESLTGRELEVIKMVAEGKINAEIADITNISIKSVECYRSRAMIKIDARNSVEATKFAITHSLVTP